MLGTKSKNNLLIIFGTIYLLVTTTRILSFWQKSDLGRTDNINSTATILGNLCALYFFYYIISCKINIIKYLKAQWPIYILVFFLLISCAWSDNPLLSTRRWLKLFFMILILIATSENIKILGNILYSYCIITVLSSLTLIIVLPEYGWMPYENKLLPIGILGHKGLLGQFSAFIIPLLLFFNKNIIWSIICAFLLLLSQTKGSLISLTISLVITTYCTFLYKRKPSFAVFITTLLLSFYILLFIIYQGEPLSKLNNNLLSLIGKDSTMTGRFPIWGLLLNIGLKKPVLGYGYNSFFSAKNASWLTGLFEWDLTNAHNGFLQAFIEIGIIGVFLFSFSLYKLLYKVYKDFDWNTPRAFWLISIFFQYLIANISSNCFLCEKFCVFSFLCLSMLVCHGTKKDIS